MVLYTFSKSRFFDSRQRIFEETSDDQNEGPSKWSIFWCLVELIFRAINCQNRGSIADFLRCWKNRIWSLLGYFFLSFLMSPRSHFFDVLTQNLGLECILNAKNEQQKMTKSNFSYILFSYNTRPPTEFRFFRFSSKVCQSLPDFCF